MIYALVGSGGKTTLLHRMAQTFRKMGKTVLVTTTTHMFTEPDTLCTDDPACILQKLQAEGYAMAGVAEGKKIRALSQETFRKVSASADVVLVEADGSKGLPLKFPNDTEPVIPENTDEILVVCGLFAIGRPLQSVCHRPALAMACLQVEETQILTAAHVQKLVTEGYLKPLRRAYPNARVRVVANHDGSLYQRAAAALLQAEQDVSLLQPEWFTPQPSLFLCGAGHVSREVAAMAARLDFPVTVMDDRDDLANRERFPLAERVICDSYQNLPRYLDPNACYVVVTPDHKADLACVCHILPTKYRYLGMIGSRKKVAATFENLKKAGFTKAQIDTIFAPIGLEIGAVTPAEIAVSILAQVIQEKNKSHGASADRALLETTEPGTLCVILQKTGSAPRGVGSMMFVGENFTRGSIGGGEPEFQAIRFAREHRNFGMQSYTLNRSAANGLDMICGGTITVAFIPLDA